MILRAAKRDDFTAITDIYAYNVAHGTGTFALYPPLESDMVAAFEAIENKGLPYLVAEKDGQILGFAYAAPFRPREGYRFGVEDSVYLRPEACGQGIGKALLNALIDQCEARGLYRMYAVIGDADNRASIGVHRSCGFVETGRLPAAGYKFDRWLDVVFMTRDLRPLERPEGNGWAAAL